MSADNWTFVDSVNCFVRFQRFAGNMQHKKKKATGSAESQLTVQPGKWDIDLWLVVKADEKKIWWAGNCRAEGAEQRKKGGKLKIKTKSFDGKIGDGGEMWPFPPSIRTAFAAFWSFIWNWIISSTWRGRGGVHSALIPLPLRIHLATKSWPLATGRRSPQPGTEPLAVLGRNKTFFSATSCSSFPPDSAPSVCSHNSGVWPRLMASNFVSLAKTRETERGGVGGREGGEEPKLGFSLHRNWFLLIWR